MNVLITGGTGFIGSALHRRLLATGHHVSVLTRNRAHARARLGERVSAVERLDELAGDHAPEAIINLAGQNLGSGRWNAQRKRLFISSRVGTTARVVDYIAQAPRPPRVLISGSAVGYYGDRGDEDLTEASPPRGEYQSELCQAWEAAALKAERHGVRVCLSRTGVVLDRDGGPLAGLLPLFRLGLGAVAGDGRQWMSWIHRDDLVGIFVRLMEDDSLRGPFNDTSPYPERNRDFAKKLGAALDRPVLLQVPGWAMHLLAGEMAHLYVTGQKVLPKRLLDIGYRFRYPTLEQAFAQMLG